MKGQPHQDRTTSATVLAKCHGLRYQMQLTGPAKSTPFLQCLGQLSLLPYVGR